MAVLPHPWRPALAARAASASSASASASETNYVAYTHHLHGNEIWHWDGRSSISLIFIVGFLCALCALFLLLVLLGRLLARINAPRTEASTVPWRREHAPMDQVQSQRSLLPPAPAYQSSAPASSTKSEATLAEAVVPLLGPGHPPASGPPPAVGNPRRNSRYGTPGVGVGSQRRPSRRSQRSSRSVSDGMHRVQSIGRGNSHRSTRRHGDLMHPPASVFPDAMRAVA